MKKLVVLTGAGISAESGLKTFRDSDGLWEGHNIMEVATPEGWHKNQELVLDFYNQRRRQLHEVKPNKGHNVLYELENDFDVHIITQNVDNLDPLFYYNTFVSSVFTMVSCLVKRYFSAVLLRLFKLHSKQART
jgi:NAD-dependent SIR2 family protein deacetylase